MCNTHASEKSPAETSIARFICRMLARNLQQSTVSQGRTVLFVGIDGAGKSTLAREILGHPEIQRRFAGARYFHWIPCGQGDFPWPPFEDRPRNTTRTSAFVSILRLLRNCLRVWWSWLTNVKELVKSGHLVILDRFVANYWLDPLSVRYSGTPAILQMAAGWLPKPDIMFILDAPAGILARRKNELSFTQIEKQREALERLPALALRSVKLDATRPVEELVANIVAELTAD
jgi:thymidylate kinase